MKGSEPLWVSAAPTWLVSRGVSANAAPTKSHPKKRQLVKRWWDHGHQRITEMNGEWRLSCLIWSCSCKLLKKIIAMTERHQNTQCITAAWGCTAVTHHTADSGCSCTQIKPCSGLNWIFIAESLYKSHFYAELGLICTKEVKVLAWHLNSRLLHETLSMWAWPKEEIKEVHDQQLAGYKMFT